MSSLSGSEHILAAAILIIDFIIRIFHACECLVTLLMKQMADNGFIILVWPGASLAAICVMMSWLRQLAGRQLKKPAPASRHYHRGGKTGEKKPHGDETKAYLSTKWASRANATEKSPAWTGVSTPLGAAAAFISYFKTQEKIMSARIGHRTLSGPSISAAACSTLSMTPLHRPPLQRRRFHMHKK